jgi:hypothetical protein
MKNIIVNIVLAVATLGFVACSGAPNDDTEMMIQEERTLAAFETTRNETLSEMLELRNSLSIHLEEVETRLAEPALSTDERSALVERKLEINAYTERMDIGVRAVEAATKEGWNKVKDGASITVKDVGEWFARQADMISGRNWLDHDKDRY